MSYYKFNENDLFYNRIETNPETSFIIYSGSVYFNSRNMESGAFTDPILHVPDGYVSLYELNVDRPAGELIYPFITKDGSLTAFRTITTDAFNNDFAYGDTLTGSYPMSASISRDYLVENTANKRLLSLKNTINYYRYLSPQFEFSSSLRGLDEIPVNLISVPSIFYGSSIKKGSIKLKFYVSGTLVAEANDEKRNGELVQVGPTGSAGSGSIVGLALYTEGFMLLTSSVQLSPHGEVYPPIGTAASASWINFATTGSGAQAAASSSFSMTFQGVNYVPTLTMFAHAKQAMLNHSSNPTYIDSTTVSSSLYQSEITGSTFYEGALKVKNTVKTPYADPTGSFQKQTYISRIGIYDKDKNLIAIAKVATPVRKRETDSYTFKLKIDF